MSHCPPLVSVEAWPIGCSSGADELRRELGIVETCEVLFKVVKLEANPEARVQINRRRHDLLGSLQTIRMGIEALQGGARFDNARGAAKIAALAKAITTLEQESSILLNLLSYD